MRPAPPAPPAAPTTPTPPTPPTTDGLGSLNRRRRSIGLRTATTFGVVFAVLAALVLLGVGVATSQGVALSLEGVPSAPGSPSSPGSPIAVERPVGSAEPGDDTLTAARVVGTIVARQQLIWSTVGVAAASVIAAGAGWFVSRRLLRPIDDIVAATQRITASTLHERIGLTGPSDELSRVASTIDGLLDRLEASFEAQRRFVAYASHELRTPLAVQRAALQIGLDDPTPDQVAAIRDQLLEVNRRSEHLVESLLALATADRGLAAGALEPVAVGDVVDEVVTGVADAARASSVHVVVDRGSFRAVEGDAVLVGQLVRNLVANAVEYNEPGGWVRVSGSVDAVGSDDSVDAVVVVENSGPVVDPEVAATLTRPFTRVAPTTTPTAAPVAAGSGGAVPARHSGLGLAIVASIARAHGWAVEVAPREGGGLRVAVGASR
ncbi:HAMP domain-containing histidine kinase [Frigoribacterium faeni]|uniref:sensor histidine kinase n=1 Tax=Frigoribacterium faeni TaxID=145483 RepID=UPI001FABA3A4|nr:HAMP domain-containing sensor histidine kinase [Frigoribacterium faeni]MCJ0702099.1 HAMP domain-containing histidine kinase [Frigoribacterium faeni]